MTVKKILSKIEGDELTGLRVADFAANAVTAVACEGTQGFLVACSILKVNFFF